MHAPRRAADDGRGARDADARGAMPRAREARRAKRMKAREVGVR